MVTSVQYPDSIEPLVQLIEETPPENIVEKTIDELRSGVSIKDMCSASGLAALRSSEIPFFPNGQWGHHGGHLHPVSGLYAVNQIASRMEGERRFLPIVQNVALTNKHVHDPTMGPYLLPEFEPLGAGTVEDTKAAFFQAVRRGSVNLADHHFLWLAEHLFPEQTLDVLLTVAIPKNLMDDHKFIYPVYTWKYLESLNWEHTPLFLRGPVRYVSQPPRAEPVKEIAALIEKYQLLHKPLRQETGDDETEAVLRTRETMSGAFENLPEVTAQALAAGLSLEGTSEALSLTASDLFLRLDTQNPMDVHMHTGINVRRHLIRINGVSLENQISALLLWNSGPEVKNAAHRLVSEPRPTPDAIAAVPHQSQEHLLNAVSQAIMANDVEAATTRAAKYGTLEYDAQALIRMLAEIACQDNLTEMHALKHHQATVEEFLTTRAPFGFLHLVAAAKAAAISYGKARAIYEKASPLLNI